ncbi:Crp/Fnr family transcriptional regulator [Chitinophaga japonensis]|uniref:CRP-like cAMP-binding protein n=1 Tax=Chitinophaga japonensis TaxID=104662 RepID=A0A562T5I8_CHIJA|nr:Crp/Fnr family transcriptional regulator [Chitinophaga japonensis]TWI88795.1 CRP-like cAMP-binding protein [Chitinophaga japonensis]
MPHQKIIRLIAGLVNIDQFDRRIIRETFEPVSYARGQVLLEAGEVARYMYFINSGYLRLYYIDQEGKEVTSHINCPMDFMTSFNSYIGQRPSYETFECITDCELLRIRHQELESLLQHNQRWAAFGKIVYEEVIKYNEQKAKDLVSLTARQRYLNLLQRFPDIIRHVPLQYIASFIGIKPESLSRIRREIIT